MLVLAPLAGRALHLTDGRIGLQEDDTLLKDGTLSQRKRMAVIVRLGEKRILQGARAKLDEDWPAGADGSATQRDKKRLRDSGKGDVAGKKQKKAKQ